MQARIVSARPGVQSSSRPAGSDICLPRDRFPGATGHLDFHDYTILFYTTNVFLISPFFIIDIFPPVVDTTNPIVFVIWVIPATEECRVP